MVVKWLMLVASHVLTVDLLRTVQVNNMLEEEYADFAHKFRNMTINQWLDEKLDSTMMSYAIFRSRPHTALEYTRWEIEN